MNRQQRLSALFLIGRDDRLGLNRMVFLELFRNSSELCYDFSRGHQERLAAWV